MADEVIDSKIVKLVKTMISETFIDSYIKKVLKELC